MALTTALIPSPGCILASTPSNLTSPLATTPSPVRNQDADDADSDADRTTGVTTQTYPLIAGQDDDTVDAGLLKYATIGDFVWNDADGNGLQDTGELGIDGVTVQLYDSTNALVDTMTTSGGGKYLFDNLLPGDYSIKVTPPTGDIFTLKGVGADFTVDSDTDRFDGTTAVTHLTSGEDDRTWDAGVLAPASLGNFVWEDLNDNGIQDSGEPGVNGVTVHLLDNLGNPVPNPNDIGGADYTTTTATVSSVDGAYKFTGLFPGVYTVKFDLLAGYDAFARQDVVTAGATDANDSDADRTTGVTAQTYTLIAGQDDDTVDAGLLKYASIGDFVWNDLNGNGLQDGGSETGIDGVTVDLYDGSGNLVDTTTTSGGGKYLFDNLLPGDYSIKVTPPGTDIFTQQNIGADTTVDSDTDRFDGTTMVTHLTSGEDDRTWDAGVLAPASLGNFVWEDLNDNGIQDSGEPGVNGVTVHLLDSLGNPVPNPNDIGGADYVLTTANDGTNNGAYKFINLFPGVYTVKFDLLAGYDAFARQDVVTAGATDANDSDADRATGVTTQTYTLIAGQDDDTIDAGLLKYATIGDFVWNDSDGNGLQDTGELGIDGVTVQLYDSTNALVDTTTSGGGGKYLFDHLLPGDYHIKVALPTDYIFTQQNVGADIIVDSDTDRFDGTTAVTHLTSGEDDRTWDAGILLQARLGNFVWEDLNDNGVQDSGEPGINSVTVHLLDNLGNPVPNPNDVGGADYVVTTANDGTNDGAYTFTGLFPGDYTVKFDLPGVNYAYARQDVTTSGGTDANDSDADRTTGVTSQLTT